VRHRPCTTIDQEDAMSKHTRTKLSLRRETLRDLTAGELSLVAGGNHNAGVSAHCEISGVAGNCEKNGTGFETTVFPTPPRNQRRYTPGQTMLQDRSIAYCLDKPPMTGYTLPPTARD
jgi:hypothetical protein